MDKTRPLNWALIGASDIAATAMIPAIRATGGEVLAVLSSSAQRGVRYAEQHGVAVSYSSLPHLLAHPGVDAVYVSTTNELHRDQVIASAAAGKHVLCEKPLATSLSDAKAMVRACKNSGVVMATNHHLRNSNSLQLMRQLIRDGEIGVPNSARVFHAVYLPQSLQGWRINKAAAGGGVVLDITVHDVDCLRYVLDANPVDAVSLSQNTGMASDALEDGNMAVLRFDNNVLAQVHVSFSVPHGGHGFEVHGDKGSIIGRNTMAFGADEELLLRNAAGERSFVIEKSDFYQRGIEAFHRAVAGEGEVAASAEDGLWSLASALAVLESANTGKRQKISL